MNCLLDSERQLKFEVRIEVDLENLIKANESFDMDSYMNFTYNKAVSKGFGLDSALSFVQLIPVKISKIISINKPVRDYLHEQGFDFNKLITLEKSFDKSLLNVSDYLGKTKSIIDEVKKQVEISNQISRETGTTPPDELISSFPYALPLSAKTTAGWGVLDGGQNPATAEMEEKQKEIIRRVLIKGDSDKLRSPIYLTPMLGSEIPDQTLVKPGELVFAITDKNGDLYLEETGKPLFYPFRNVIKYEDTYSTRFELAPLSALVKQYADSGKEVTLEEAGKIRNQQLKQVYDLQEYIKDNPKERLITVIVGGSLGQVTFDYDIRTPLSALKENINIDIKKNGVTQFYVKGFDKPVILQRYDMGDEMIDKLVSTLIDPIKETVAGTIQELSPKRRLYLLSQHLYTRGPSTIYINNDGELKLTLRGEDVDLKGSEARGIITNFFKTYGPTPGFNEKQLTDEEKAKVLDESDPDFLSKLRRGIIVRKTIVDGKVYYEKYTRPPFNINKDFKHSKFNDYSLVEQEGGLTLKSNIVEYDDWLANNTYINYKLNKEGKIVALNSYFTYRLTDETKNKLYPKEGTTIEERQFKSDTGITEQGSGYTQSVKDASKSFGERLKKRGLSKAIDIKEFDLKATKKQISKAKAWYESSPLNKFFPFESLFNVVNSDFVAEWFESGIRLFKGSDYSDLYHEAWHAFSQGFLTKEEKTSLYDEVKKHSGSFITHTGKRVVFNKAGYLEIEEYLAEDFRKYMLSGGKLVMDKSPVRNTLFRRILNFLKSLFGNTTYAQLMINDQSVNTIRDLYEKLRIGNINEKSFSMENAVFNTLAKNLTATDKTSVIQELSATESALVVDTIDSIWSDIVDKWNRDNPGNRITSQVFSTKEGRQFAYEEVVTRKKNGEYSGIIPSRRKEVFWKLKETIDLKEKDILQRNLDTLDFIIHNFGNPNDPEGKQQKDTNGHPIGVIAYHNDKSKFLSFEDKFLDEKDDNTPNSGEFRVYKDGNELTVYERGKSGTWYLIKGLHQLDKKGKIVNNRVGFPKLVNFTITSNHLKKILANHSTPEEMWKALNDNITRYPYIKQLTDKLGNPKLINDPNISATTQDALYASWGDFVQTFNSYEIPFPTVFLNWKGTQFHTTVGLASADHKLVQRDWNEKFRAGLTDSDPGIVVKKKGVSSYIDIQAVFKKYPKIDRSNLVVFLNDIGIGLEQNEDILQRIQDDIKYDNTGDYIKNRMIDLYLTRLYETLYSQGFQIASADLKALALNNQIPSSIYDNSKITDIKSQRGQQAVKIIKSFIDSPSQQGRIENLTDLFLKNITNRYGEGGKNEATSYDSLAKLQVQYSGQFAEQVSTPTGDSKSIYSLNSTFTAVIRAINNAKTYQELIDQFSFFDQGRNVLLRSSKRLQALFDFSKGGIRNNTKFVIENLNGVTLLEDGESTNVGISSSSSDPATKYAMDMAYLFQRGISENPKHGDKSTAYAVYTRYKSPYSKNGRLWMDPEHFLDSDISDKIYESVLPYLIDEHTRILIMRNARPGDAEYNYPQYLERGKYFQTFDDMSEETKKELYKITIPLGEYFKKDTAESRKLEQMIYNDFTSYFNKLSDQGRERFEDAGFIGDNILDKLLERKTDFQKKKGNINPFEKLTREQMKDILIRAFEFNTWINHTETSIMFYGDIAQYDDYEFHKRIAMLGSAGDTFMVDPISLQYINDKGMLYARSLGFNNTLDRKAKTGVMSDPIIQSVYYDMIYNALYKFQLKTGKSEEQAKSIATNEALAYTKMKPGDAQAWITFDAYRALRMLDRKWSGIQETLYQKIVNSEDIEEIEISEHFPVLKYQYAGALDTKEGLPVTAAHKYSLFPLIPNVTDNHPVLKSLHERLMKDNFIYATLKSGSKITTVTDQGVMDKFYTDINESNDVDPKALTPNVIYLDFLKDQQNISEKYKGKVTISTQERKVIEEGFMENGVPTDFHMDLDPTERELLWNTLQEPEKLRVSSKYKMIIEYEKSINELTKAKRLELERKIGWDKPGLRGKITQELVNIIDKELKRQDLSDHEREVIQLRTPDGHELKYGDLSYHISAERLEKVLASLVNRSLVRQKINGEPLVQVSGLGFESPEYIEFRQKLTPQERKKYGANELTYYINEGREIILNGKKVKITQAAKCKVSFMPVFKPLLKLIHPDGLVMRTRERLNEAVKDNKWLDAEDHRKIITLVGPRIPVQEQNSMEFEEVWEFLPETTGNIIVHPIEIVAKSGSDFDVDKVSMMIPNIRYDKFLGKTILFRNYSDKEARQLYDIAKAYALEKKKRRIETETSLGEDEASNRLLYNIMEVAAKNIKKQDIEKAVSSGKIRSFYDFQQELEYEFDMDVLNMFEEEEKFLTFEQFKETLNGTKVAENNYMEMSHRLLQHADNYASLVRPNGTFTMDPIADELRKYVIDYDPDYRVFGNPKDKPSYSRNMEYGYNNYIHMINKTGLESLAIAAVDNPANVNFNRVGFHMNYEYNDNGVVKRITINLPHNTKRDKSNREVVSLSQLMDAHNEERISGNISQVINLLLEMNKNDAGAYLQLNREAIPTVLFLDQAGVPIRHLIYFASQPIIRQYLKETRIARSPIAIALGRAPMRYSRSAERQVLAPNFYKIKARTSMYTGELGHPVIPDPNRPYFTFNPRGNTKIIQDLYDQAGALINANTIEQDGIRVFDKNKLLERIIDGKKKPDVPYTDFDKAVLLHWFEIEKMAEGIRDIKLHLNPDTKTSTSAYSTMTKQQQILRLTADGRFPAELIEALMADSAISSFFSVQRFMIEFLNPLFPQRANTIIGTFLYSKLSDLKNMDRIQEAFDTPEKLAIRFFSDLISYIFQNKLQTFDLGNLKGYRNINSRKELNVNKVPYLPNGVVVKDDILYYNVEQLVKDFSKRNYTNKSYTDRGLATLPQSTFRSAAEFYHYVFEREYIRSNTPMINVMTDSHFLGLKAANSKIKQLKDEDNDTYQDRLNRITYEQFIRDRALENIANADKLFYGDDSYATQVMRAIKDHKLNEEDKYPILDMMTIKYGTGRNPMVNLQLLDTDLREPSKVNQFNQALVELADPAVIKTEDPLDNLKISEIFHKFPVVMILQSGLSAAGSYSLIRLVPETGFLDFMQGAMDEFTSQISKDDTELEAFYLRFLGENSKFTANRHKNYVMADRFTGSLEEAGVTRLSSAQSIPVYDTYTGHLVYDPIGITEAKINKTIEESSGEEIFVYDKAENDKSPQDTGLFSKHVTTNQTLGLPTLIYYDRTALKLNQEATVFTDKTLDNNKLLIDQSIDSLVQLRDNGYVPVFSLGGYGQRMLGLEPDGVTRIRLIKGKPGLQTFLYLSEQLYKNFNYINKNYEVQEVSDTVDTPQEVLLSKTPAEIRDLIRHCLT